ncbi:hypothetical protein BC629DRAFT_919883 [Irpex lacteus]|nr:hypothetical protein BC629DRAFT_919883 [Irpex lacteus]
MNKNIDAKTMSTMLSTTISLMGRPRRLAALTRPAFDQLSQSERRSQYVDRYSRWFSAPSATLVSHCSESRAVDIIRSMTYGNTRRSAPRSIKSVSVITIQTSNSSPSRLPMAFFHACRSRSRIAVSYPAAVFWFVPGAENKRKARGTPRLASSTPITMNKSSFLLLMPNVPSRITYFKALVFFRSRCIMEDGIVKGLIEL